MNRKRGYILYIEKRKVKEKDGGYCIRIRRGEHIICILYRIKRGRMS